MQCDKALFEENQDIIKLSHRRTRPSLPNGIQIGERFLLSFDDPELAVAPYQGRLQDLSKDGLLCVDAPLDMRPPRGTAVTVHSIHRAAGDFSFASEIQGRGRLKGRLPVLLLSPPVEVEEQQRRSAYRISVCLRAQIECFEATADGERVASKPCVATNLSGGGAQVFVRYAPAAEDLRLALTVPNSFVEETVRSKRGSSRLTDQRTLALDPFLKVRQRLQERLSGIEAQIVSSHLHLKDSKGAITAISLAFAESQETCYQLVRHLERQSIKKGVGSPAELTQNDNETISIDFVTRQGSPNSMTTVAPAA